jgi:hypothetical protein
MNPADVPAVSRRQFVKLTTLASVAIAGGRTSLAMLREPSGDKPLYTVPLLGDIHYDKFSHHDMEWVRKEKPGDERQINNYVMVTETLTPRLLAGVKDAIKTAPAPTPFVIQVGDLVEGLCGSYDLQALQFRDTFAAIDAAALGAPFLITKGNHDITGPGAVEAYDKVLIPWLAAQGKQEKFAGASYFRKHDDDLFIFFDGYKPDINWLEQTLRLNKARHAFFITHQPVIPYNARANWCTFSRDAAKQAQLLSLLAQYNVLVLGGHLHKYCLLTRKVDTGSVTQLAVSSVLRNARENTPKDPLSGVEKYNGDLVNLEPNHSPDTVEARRAILNAEAPSILRYEYSDIPGYAMLKVYADRVDADIYISLATEPWKTDALHRAAKA